MKTKDWEDKFDGVESAMILFIESLLDEQREQILAGLPKEWKTKSE